MDVKPREEIFYEMQDIYNSNHTVEKLDILTSWSNLTTTSVGQVGKYFWV